MPDHRITLDGTATKLEPIHVGESESCPWLESRDLSSIQDSILGVIQNILKWQQSLLNVSALACRVLRLCILAARPKVFRTRMGHAQEDKREKEEAGKLLWCWFKQSVNVDARVERESIIPTLPMKGFLTTPACLVLTTGSANPRLYRTYASVVLTKAFSQFSAGRNLPLQGAPAFPPAGLVLQLGAFSPLTC